MTRRSSLALAAAIALCAAGVTACKTKKADKSGPVLANVGDETITADDFKRRLDETSPFLRARYNTPERKKEFLENLIKNELLAQEAQRRGLDKTPAVQEVVKRAMVQELLRQQLDEKLAGGDLGDGELKKFYEGHVDDYVKPERIRIHHLLVAAEPNDQARRREGRAKALRLLEDITQREAKGEINAFQVVAMKESNDPQSAPVGGDMRYLSKEEMTKELGEAVASAVFQMQKPGDKAGPIETPKGFEIVKLQNKTVALDKKYDDVKEMVRQRMARERRSKDYDDFIKRLRDGGNVKLNEAEIAKLPNPETGPNMQFPGAPDVAAMHGVPPGRPGGMNGAVQGGIGGNPNQRPPPPRQPPVASTPR